MKSSIYIQKKKLLEEKRTILMKLISVVKEEEKLELLLCETNKKLNHFNNIANKTLERIRGNNAMTKVFLRKLEGVSLKQIAIEEGMSYDYVRELSSKLNDIFGNL